MHSIEKGIGYRSVIFCAVNGNCIKIKIVSSPASGCKNQTKVLCRSVSLGVY